MQFKTPKVFHIACTAVNEATASKWLAHIGAEDWTTDAPGFGEYLVELCGRRCYKSFGTELNPNITKVRSGNRNYIGNILNTQHGSVIEHAYDTFAFEDVSRVFTHELVRHRLANFSQESMRFVRPTDLSSIFPQVYTDHLPPEKAKHVQELFRSTFSRIEEIQQELVNICGMDDPNLSFTIKKLFQSANRRLIPDGVLTGIIMTANHRTWRFVIQQRTSLGAEEEIRYAIFQVYQTLSTCHPALYQDASLVNSQEVYGELIPEVIFKNHKV
jgi:thymidylate synthase (FAD)